jgi:serine/threonine-protein kinase HipA
VPRSQEGSENGSSTVYLHEIDYLLLVDDEARQGALRFAEREGGSFLREGGVNLIPPLVELPKLLSAAERVIEERDTEDDLRLLFAPGSALGGARPKASVVLKHGHLAIAKFPRWDDEYNTVLWEAAAMALARKSGIAVAESRLDVIGGKSALLLKRFDRDGVRRIPFLSAMSMLGARDNQPHSYMEIVDALRQHGAAPREDMEALWRRLVFNILISNTDDHLRNHGFLYEGRDGWRLSPAYDLNPMPVDIKPRILTTAINEDDTAASLALALDVAGYFELKADRARQIIAEVGKVASKWREEAGRVGLTKPEIERVASAFEHRDMEMARGR